MKVKCALIEHLHLDPGYALLSVQNCLTCIEFFRLIDVHANERLNDIQFHIIMNNITNVGRGEIQIIFDLLDRDHSGEMEFDEFYLIFCILIASKDSYEKEFIYRHSKSMFQLIDADRSGYINISEFNHMGILFNFDSGAITNIFHQFDASGDRALDFQEFRLFTMACIDEGRAVDARQKSRALSEYHSRLMDQIEPLLRRFVRTEQLPLPSEVEQAVQSVRKPYISVTRKFKLSSVLDLSLAREVVNEKMTYYVKAWIVYANSIFSACSRKIWGDRPNQKRSMRFINKFLQYFKSTRKPLGKRRDSYTVPSETNIRVSKRQSMFPRKSVIDLPPPPTKKHKLRRCNIL